MSRVADTAPKVTANAQYGSTIGQQRPLPSRGTPGTPLQIVCIPDTAEDGVSGIKTTTQVHLIISVMCTRQQLSTAYCPHYTQSTNNPSRKSAIYESSANQAWAATRFGKRFQKILTQVQEFFNVGLCNGTCTCFSMHKCRHVFIL